MVDISVSIDEKDPLYDAVRQCCVYILQMFPPGAIRSYRGVRSDMLFHTAVVHCPEAIPILAKYIDVNVRNEYCETALDIAARDGNVEAVRLLLEAGADPAARDDRCGGETPLHSVAYYGHIDIVRLFPSRGTDPNLRNHRDVAPLHYVVRECREIRSCELVELLINHGADPNIRDKYGRTPLEVMFTRGQIEVILNILARYNLATP
jgi:ankyrin repeat protein